MWKQVTVLHDEAEMKQSVVLNILLTENICVRAAAQLLAHPIRFALYIKFLSNYDGESSALK